MPKKKAAATKRAAKIPLRKSVGKWKPTKVKKKAAPALKISKGVRRKRAMPQLLVASKTPVPLPISTVAPIARMVPLPSARRRTVAQITKLPDHYAEDLLVLLPRDPRWMFAYWELREPSVRRARVASAMGRAVLRVYDVTDIHFDGFNAHRLFDIEVRMEDGNWYVHAPEAGRTYLTEIGFRAADGTFTPIVRSNPAGMPPETVSPVIFDQFITIRADVPLHRINPALLRKVAEGHVLTEEERGELFALSAGLQLGLSERQMERQWRTHIRRGTVGAAGSAR